MASSDFEIWRGNSYRVIGWNFPFDLEGSEIVLNIVWKDGSLTKTTADGGLVIENVVLSGSEDPQPVVWWGITTEESRLLPQGRGARYEVERKSLAEERTYVYGRITTRGGLNTDE